MAFTLVSTQTIIARNAGALYGVEVGNANMSSYVTAAGSNTDAFLNTVYTNSVGNASTASVAAVLVAGLGITGDAATAATNYIVGQLNAVAVNARGAAINSMLSAFSNMTSDTTFGSFATAWNTQVNNAVAYAAVSGNADASWANVSATPAGQSFVLTTGTDSGASFTGGSGNDTFNASYSAATGMTLTSDDSLNGGAGTDTLNATVGTTGTVQATISNIEAIKGTFSAAGTISMLGTSGATSVTSSGSTAAATFTNIGSTAVTLGVSNSDQNATFNYTTAAVAGTADTVNVTLSNMTAGTLTINGATGNVETVAINSTGSSNSLTALVTTNATKVVVTGDQTLGLGTLEASILTLDANAATAGVTATTAGATAVTVTGGSGNDAFTVGNASVNDKIDAGAGNDTITFSANLTNADTVTGGAGTDTLVATYANANAYVKPATATITGVEVLQLSSALTGAVTVTDLGTGITTVSLAAGTNAGTLTMEAGADTVKLRGASVAGLTLNDTGTATTDSVTISNSAAATNVLAGQALTIGGFETTTINTSGTGAAAAQTIGAIGITPDSGGSVTLNFAGSNSVTTGVITASSATSGKVDASGLTGTAVFSNTGAATVGITNIVGSANSDVIVGSSTSTTIDGGAGNDSITGGAGNDNIVGGLGNDTITAAAGNDSINAGDGNDLIVLGDNLTQADTIDGGNDTDTLSITQATITAVNALSFSNGSLLNTNLSNVERLLITDAVTSGVDMSRLDNIGYITLNAGGGGQTFSGMVANSTVVIGDTTGGVFTYADASGSADVINFVLTDTDGTPSDETFTLVQANSIENINISTREEVADAANVRTYTVSTLTAGSATTTTITGTENLTVTNATTLTNVDASTFGAALVLSSANAAAAVTITTNTGADSIIGGVLGDTISTGAGNDTLVGGAGNDTLTAGTGSDLIVGGAGNDRIVLTESSNSTDTVMLGSTDSAGTNLTLAAANADAIIGFTAGATNGDVLKFDVGTIVTTNTTLKVAQLSADGATLTSIANSAVAGNVDVVIVQGTFAAYSAVQVALNATAATITDATDGAVVVWADGSGVTHVTYDTDISAGAGTGTELATLDTNVVATLVGANFASA